MMPNLLLSSFVVSVKRDLMKIITTFIFICCLSTVFGQFSLSAGVGRRAEGLTNLKDYFSFHTDSLRNVNDYLFLKGNYSVKKFAGNVELSYLPKNKMETYSAVSSFTGGGSSSTYSRRDEYAATTDYAYLGLKIGGNFHFAGKSLFKKATSTTQFGAFVQLDFLLTHRDYNFWSRQQVSNNSNMNHTMVVVKDEESNAPFDVLAYKSPFISGGLQFNRRLMFQHVFLELNIAAGLFKHNRTTVIHAGEENAGPMKMALDAGVGIGYVFGQRSK